MHGGRGASGRLRHSRDVHCPHYTRHGDAYRAGIIKGLLYDYSLEQMGRIAALAATYCVEQYGTQNHSYTPAEFAVRYAENFPDVPMPQANVVSAGQV